MMIMKKNKSNFNKNDKKAVSINIVMSILIVAVLSFISIGYALYGQVLNSRGNISLGLQGKIAITNVELTSSTNVRPDSIPSFTDDSVNFNLTFEKGEGATEPNYQAVYSITINNGTFYDYEFNLANFQPVITNSSGINVDPSYLTSSLSGISLGDMIRAGEEVTFTLTLDFAPEDDDTYSVDGGIETDLIEEPHGDLLGTVPDGASGDLRASLSNDIASFSITVINSYQTARTFNLNISDTSHFRLTDSNGSDLGSFTINGGSTETYTFYVKRVDGAIFTNDSLTTSISLSYSENPNVYCGNITLLVDAVAEKDETPPLISNVVATINNATSNDTSANDVGSVTVSWNGVDAESGVKKYYVVAQGPNGSSTYETTDDSNSLTITGLADGSYTFKVYGENNDNVKPDDDAISSPETGQGVCSISTSYSFDWHYTVSFSSDTSNMQNLSVTAVNRGFNYSTTLKANTNYNLPSSLNYVTMGGTSISTTTGTQSGRYRYTSSSGAFNVYGVTGDIVIKITPTRSSGGCTG